MSINWVMLHQTQGFVRLPGEKPVWQSSSRTSLAITTPRTYPGHNPFSINSASGTIYLTNQRVVYLPVTPTQQFRSFSAALVNLHDSHVTVPWFGPNVWQAIVQPVPGGNIPPEHISIEIKFTFKEGGATDFHSNFERIKERFQQALESAQATGDTPLRTGGALGGVNMDSVHLEQLPTYEAARQDRAADPNLMPGPSPATSDEHSGASSIQPAGVGQSQSNNMPQHTDVPPGYEETQQQSAREQLESRLSQE